MLHITLWISLLVPWLNFRCSDNDCTRIFTPGKICSAIPNSTLQFIAHALHHEPKSLYREEQTSLLVYALWLCNHFCSVRQLKSDSDRCRELSSCYTFFIVHLPLFYLYSLGLAFSMMRVSLIMSISLDVDTYSSQSRLLRFIVMLYCYA